MKKIITAFANAELNEKISKEKEYEIILPDIQYQEAVLEILENNKNIDILVLNSILPGDFNLYTFINRIKEINNNLKIIVLLEKKDEEIKNFLFSKGINNIFYNNEITIEELIRKLKEENNIIPDEINKEIKLLKEMILNNYKLSNNKKLKNKNNKIKNITLITKVFKINNKIINKTNKIIILIKKKLNKNNKNINKSIKIISTIGQGGVGKSVFAAIISKAIINKKILVIDFDFINNNISTIFGVEKIPKKIKQEINENKLNKNKLSFEELIIKINNKLDLICGIGEFLNGNETKQEEIKKITKIIKENSVKYDLIIIDTNSDNKNDYLKEIIKISDKNILLVEPNLLGIKRSKKILEKYINKWGIDKEKISIVFNKVNISSINNLLLNQLFSDFNILGQIKLNNKYDYLINNNLKIKDKKIKQEYLKIINKLMIKEEIENGYEFIRN